LFHLPTWVSSLANFDGLHYISIAHNGYAQYEQAFFPLYPMLIKFLSPLFSNNQLLTGLIISNISFLIGLIIFYKYLFLIRATTRVAPTVIFLLLAFPTSFFFGAVYTEGLFFLLLISTLYFLKKERYFLVMVFAFLASLTRLVGVFLIIPIIFHLIEQERATTRVAPTTNFNKFQRISILFAPILGLASYCFYLWRTTGDPLFFLTSQPIFGANRSTHLILLPQVYYRYFKIFITAAHDSRFYVSLVEFTVFSFVLLILILDLIKLACASKNLKIKNWERISLSIFSFVNLILPTLTGTFSSIPRYALFSVSFFIFLAEIKNNIVKFSIAIIFLILHILLLGYFTQGYFIS
jgi:hypothetical protein